MAASSSTPLTSMMSASCSRDASSAGRVADIVVQFENRRPVCVVRRVYFVVSFDEEGRLDTRRFLQQQWALVESALGPVLAEPNQGDRILDAASRSIAQGGRWRPKADLAQLIDEAVLGRRWSRSAGHALALPKGDVRGYRQSARSGHRRSIVFGLFKKTNDQLVVAEQLELEEMDHQEFQPQWVQVEQEQHLQ